MKETTHRNYKRLWRSGGSRVLTVGSLLPTDWELVKVVVEDTLKKDGREWVRIRIERVV